MSSGNDRMREHSATYKYIASTSAIAEAGSQECMHALDPLRLVVGNGYCVGCGACASVPGSPIRMGANDYGQFEAVLPHSMTEDCSRSLGAVCPFSEVSENEDEIAKGLYSDSCHHDTRIGYYRALYAGYVNEGSYRTDGSSGGLTSWLLCELMARGCIDGVVHVISSAPSAGGVIFEYGISKTEGAVRSSSKSRYYPVEFSEALKILTLTPGRFAFVGVPCFVKAVRLLQKQPSFPADRIAFTVSLFCGHLKSTAYGAALAWQMGIPPGQLIGIDFRAKAAGRPASTYTVRVNGTVHGEQVDKSASADDLYGTDWGLGFFKYKACDYCDDVAGEVADISIGDAWLPEFTDDWRGHNIVVCRHKILHTLLENAVQDRRIALTPVGPDDVVRSQDGAYRHKRAFLGSRLRSAHCSGAWYPPKRFGNASSRYPLFVQRQQDLRTKISEKSHEAFLRAVSANDFEVFNSTMRPLVSEYYRLLNPLWMRCLRRSWRFLRPLTKVLGNQSAMTTFRWAVAEVLLKATGRRA